jgi:hypothetical protein
MAVAARDSIEPPTPTISLLEKNSGHTDKTYAACLSLHWSPFKKPEFAGISAGFSFVGAEGRAEKTKWRRERDSNPRSPFRLSGFQDRLFQPLTHPSAVLFYRRLAGNGASLRY